MEYLRMVHHRSGYGVVCDGGGDRKPSMKDDGMSIVTSGLLAEIPLFSNMDDEERSELRSLMTERIFQPGQIVMKAGELGGAFQVIEQGEEAIFLSIFVLVSQNRQAVKDRISAELDYQVNVKAEMEMSVMASQIREIEGKLHHIHRDLLEAKTIPIH
jgi:hypothetical protein